MNDERYPIDSPDEGRVYLMYEVLLSSKNALKNDRKLYEDFKKSGIIRKHGLIGVALWVSDYLYKLYKEMM